MSFKGLTFWVALALMATGCSSPEGPSDDAVGAYLQRQGGPGYQAPTTGVGSGSETAVRKIFVPPRPRTAVRIVVTVESASGLPDEDDGPGVTDPYVIVEYEGQHFRTSVIEGEQEPTWGDSFVLQVIPGGVLQLSLMDEDALGSDHTMGVVSQALADIGEGETVKLSVPFRRGEAGTVELTLSGLVAAKR
ncbi:MAG: hypothetical protein ACI9MR_001316 [Myxococcota bacterium]|jgi:hypothetical protein